jgi:hypothetical protein
VAGATVAIVHPIRKGGEVELGAADTVMARNGPAPERDCGWQPAVSAETTIRSREAESPAVLR